METYGATWAYIPRHTSHSLQRAEIQVNSNTLNVITSFSLERWKLRCSSIQLNAMEECRDPRLKKHNNLRHAASCTSLHRVTSSHVTTIPCTFRTTVSSSLILALEECSSFLEGVECSLPDAATVALIIDAVLFSVLCHHTTI